MKPVLSCYSVLTAVTYTVELWTTWVDKAEDTMEVVS